MVVTKNINPVVRYLPLGMVLASIISTASIAYWQIGELRQDLAITHAEVASLKTQVAILTTHIEHIRKDIDRRTGNERTHETAGR